MYAKQAYQLGFQTKLAGRAGSAKVLFSALPRAKNPLLFEIQGATEQALTGAFLGEAVTDLVNKDHQRGLAALVGGGVLGGQHLGGRFLPKRLFAATYNKTLNGIPVNRLREAEKAIRAGGGFTNKQISAGKGLGALAGLVTGLLAWQGVKYLMAPKKKK